MFDVVAEADVAPAEGWFAGIDLRAGDELLGGEAVVLYQRDEQGEWLAVTHTLMHAPRRAP